MVWCVDLEELEPKLDEDRRLEQLHELVDLHEEANRDLDLGSTLVSIRVLSDARSSELALSWKLLLRMCLSPVSSSAVSRIKLRVCTMMLANSRSGVFRSTAARLI